MNNQTNNENLSQSTNSQPDEYSAYRDEEYERMRIEMEKRRAERRAREHRRVMKNRIIAIAIHHQKENLRQQQSRRNKA